MDAISNPNHEPLVLTRGDKTVFLVGTAHVSRQSAELVSSIIADKRPDTVCVELCQPRFDSIRDRNKWREMDLFKVVKENKAFLLLANLLLASFQKKIADQFGIKPGEDMISAITAAEAVGARIHLADREIRITLARIWKAVGFFSKMKLLFQLLTAIVGADDVKEEDIERLKQEDVLQVMLSELGSSFPVLQKILVYERDRYLAHRIKNAPGQTIVAVVGAAHVPGIRQFWDTEDDITELDTVPPPGIFSQIVKWSLPLAIIAVLAAGFIYGGKDTGMQLVGIWVGVTSAMAALGAIVSWSHPITILVSAVVAPVTTLHPLLAAGWIAGLSEALLKKPTVGDLEDLPQDITSLKGFWKNRATHILLVTALVNLTASLGTFIAIPLIARAFGH
ncbi:MAG: TraB/GumN family protein [Thermodesulfobacteriota bacterium]